MSDGSPYNTDDEQAIVKERNGDQKSYQSTGAYNQSSVSGYQSTGAQSSVVPSDSLMSRAHLPNTTTNAQSMMHLMKGMIGSGILAIPKAVEQAGLWTGFFGLLIMGVIATTCMHQLVRSSHALCRRLGCVELNYGKCVQQAFKTGPQPFRKFTKIAYILIQIFICITQLGFCIVYILFIADNIQQVVENLTSFHDMPVQAYQALVLVVLVPLVYIKNLAALAPLSVLANILTVCGLCVIFYYCVQDLPPTTAYPSFNSWATLPMYFGTAVYAFEGIGVVLPIENKMKYPQDFGGYFGVMNVSMVVTTCLYAGVGFFGYMKAGPKVEGSITLNLPHTAFYSAVKILFAGAIYITYALQFYVPFNIIWPKLERRVTDETRKVYYEYIFRTAIVVGTFAISAVVPHLDLMIALIGALSSSAIALIFPPILDSLVFWPDQLGRHRWKLGLNICIMVFGLTGFVAGTSVTLIQIVKTF